MRLGTRAASAGTLRRAGGARSRHRHSMTRARPASGAPCSARTAPARRRCSTRSPATSRRPAARIRFFGEDMTDFPAYERIRRGLRRTYQISLLFGGLSVIDIDLSRLPRRLAAALLAAPAAPRRRDHGAGASDPARRAARGHRATRWSPSSATASSASSRSRWRSPARRASSCSTSRPPACRRPSGATWSQILNALPDAYRLHHHRARSRRGAARLRARDDDAQRAHLQGRHAARRSRTIPRCRRSISEAAMAEREPAAKADRSGSATCRSTTASRTPSRAST